MESEIVSSTFYYVMVRDNRGDILKTEVFKNESDRFQAYSFYVQDKDEEFIGHGESKDENIAIKKSRQDLRRKWKRNRSAI